MRTSALLMTGALLVPFAAQALPVLSPAPAAASESTPGDNSAAQLAEARARLTAAIAARDSILTEMKESGASTADIQSAAQAYARANAQAEAAQQAYDAAVAKASGFDSAKKGYDDAAAAMPHLTTNAESTKARRDAAQAAYDKAIAPNPEAAKAAQEKVDAARAKLEESKAAAQQQWDRGALGFYETRSAQKALDVFSTDKDYLGKPLASYTHPGAADDATNLDSMAKTLNLINKINELRAQHQLEPLKVTDYLMAVAQLQVNAQSRTNKMAHIKAFNVAENLASARYAGDELSLKLWYHNEKALHDQGVTDFAKVGHYLNIVNRDYTVTGMAYAPNIQANTFDHTPLYGDHSEAQTVAEYSDSLQRYMNGLKDEMAHGSSPARTNLADATAELEAATQGTTESVEAQVAKAKLETATREYEAAKAALDAGQAKLTAATETYESAKSAKQAVQKLAEQLAAASAERDRAAARAAQLGEFGQRLAAAEADVARAQADVDRLSPAPAPKPTPGGPGTDMPATGNVFYVSNDWTSRQASNVFSYGRAGDEVLVGDWDGDGVDTFAVRRGNKIYVKNSVDGGAADVEFSYGRAGDEILVGDFDGDGKDTFAVRRGNTFYVLNSLHGGEADKVVHYGRAGDTVLTGDFDGDGKDTFAVRRGNLYYVKNVIGGGAADTVFSYGRAGDATILGDFDGDGVDTLAVRRGNTVYVKNSLTAGEADQVLTYGRASDQLFVGDWDGNGTDTPAVRR
ncbi:CAP domain-containing protein [Actinotignum sp. GS-2025f]|uniref:CAP domain-containing protein n=1 Tax=unclassified Actinotignum TaxID=2632702 RepID=UPI002A830B2D|nr:CAP domain-containing protein [Actinotignum sp. SLA_B059]MDY5128017.1 CAP domain-containing protein [Actinotignum sp. SLA_B059]